MANYNLQAGYGKLLSEKVMTAGPMGAGKTFLVAPTTHPNYQMFQETFRPDSEGVIRLYNTIAAAVAACTASRGDVIYVAEGHAETITGAAGIALSVAGVSVFGLGNGSLRPTITFSTNTAATLTMTAANVSLQNFSFDMTGIDAVASGIVVSAAGVSIRHCYFLLATAAAQATLGILTTAGANNLVLDGNQFVGTSDAGTTAAVRLVGGDSIVVSNNYFLGAYTSGVGAIQGLTTDQTNLTVYNNTIINLTASATKAAVFTSGTTGIIAKNICGIGSGAAPFTAAAAFWAGNWSAAAVATNGTLV